MPRIASRSSTRWNGPLFWRNCTMALAVAGPIPGTCANCAAVAVFRSSGFAGGVFLASAALAVNRAQQSSRKQQARRRRSVVRIARWASGSFGFCIVFRDFTKQLGLVGNLPAVAHDDDLRISRIEIAPRRGQNVRGRERADTLPKRLQVVLRQV